MNEIERLTDELRRAHEAGAWHGPSVRENLEGVTAAVAAGHPIPGGHSIWELVLHITAWRGEVARRLEGGDPSVPAEGDWPVVTDTSDAAWAEARRQLDLSHRRLVETVTRFAEGTLDEPVGRKPPDRSLGTVGSYYVMLHGIAQHDAYHSGQVGVLRKLA